MQHGMFAAADVEIHRHPVALFCLIDEPVMILRINKSQKIPARAGPLRHCVGFTISRSSALRTDRYFPELTILFPDTSKRRLEHFHYANSACCATMARVRLLRYIYFRLEIFRLRQYKW